MEKPETNILKIHFVGIGGIGMSALAQLCHALGHQVSGTNLGRTPIFDALEQSGIKDLHETHDPKFLPQGCNLVIYSEAVPETNSERQAATSLQINQKNYFEGLGLFLQQHCTIAVTGTHGKTTTVGLLASAMIEAGLDPCVIVGAKMNMFEGSNFRSNAFSAEKGTKPWAVAEACEYRNNFQYLDPEIVLLTNIELDHVDYYRDEDHYLETFVDFCQKSKVVIYHEGDEKSKKVLENYAGLKIAVKKTEYENLTLSVSGEHNRANAGLALACGKYLLNSELQNFHKGLEAFTGAWRRQEVIGEIEGVTIYDDYGHHPTEIKATLQGLRERHPDSKIALIFEPHQYSRTREFFDEFLTSFDSADITGLFPIYEARDTEADKKAVSLDDFVEKNPSIKKIENPDEVRNITNQLSPGDVLIFMGAGKISEFARNFLKNKLK